MKKLKKKISRWLGKKDPSPHKPIWEEITLRPETEDLDTLREKIVIAAMSYLKRKDYTEAGDRMLVVNAAMYDDIGFLCLVQAPFDKDVVYEVSNLSEDRKYTLKHKVI